LLGEITRRICLYRTPAFVLLKISWVLVEQPNFLIILYTLFYKNIYTLYKDIEYEMGQKVKNILSALYFDIYIFKTP